MNQNPEQLVRDERKPMLYAFIWVVQPKNKINLSAHIGVSILEYGRYEPNDDNCLFLDLYGIILLYSFFMSKDNQVYISTIQ